jgi:tripartite-type tricarboxylate transporter receptor subunit TctC
MTRASRLHRTAAACVIGAIAALAVFGGTACAAGFPDKPITIIVPYTAGGSSDALARLLGKQLSEQLGQPVLVDNKPGAGATVGTAQVAKAPADGYTLLLADTAQTTAPALYPRLSYDAVTSFRAVGMIGVTPAMLFASEQSKLKSVKDMVAAQKKQPEGISIGIGSGSASQFISELFQIRSRVKLQMVPYKGASQAVIDVLGGQIDLIFTNPASAAQYLKTGKLNAIGVTGTQRHPAFPDTPTFREQGVEGMNVSYWFALLLPAGVPEPIAQRWEKELAKALASAPVSRSLAELGITPGKTTSAQTQRFLAEDKATWAKIAKAAGIKPQ